jgi:hypothetical protein
MRLTKIYLLFILCISALKASAFNVDTLYICKGYCINYTNVTTQGIAVAWQWTFQGASTASSTLQNPPNICYPTAGIFKTTVTQRYWLLSGKYTASIANNNVFSWDSIPVEYWS